MSPSRGRAGARIAGQAEAAKALRFAPALRAAAGAAGLDGPRPGRQMGN
ncbi:MAG: hypothetical protein IMX01_10595 [Limnochordaceae bacterium]|nr:hypothetical protein [Limnochordaceae bacterium]